MRSRRTGFSLVEALVALTLFGVGTIVLMQLAPRASQYANHARALSEASGLAQAKVEELRSLPKLHADLTAGVHVDPENPIGGNYERRWEVFENDPIEGMRRVEMRVRAMQTARGDSVAVLTTYF
jgi:type II secretory pathway pseudopilin PulG